MHFFISTLMSGLLQIPRTTLNDRFCNKHSSRQEYYSKCRLLNDSEEAVLTDWMDTLVMQGLPFDANLLRSHVHDLTGEVPGVNRNMLMKIKTSWSIIHTFRVFLQPCSIKSSEIWGPQDKPANPPQHQPALPAILTYPNTNESFPFAHTNAGEHTGTSSATHRVRQPNSFSLTPSHPYHYYPSYNPYINP